MYQTSRLAWTEETVSHFLQNNVGWQHTWKVTLTLSEPDGAMGYPGKVPLLNEGFPGDSCCRGFVGCCLSMWHLYNRLFYIPVKCGMLQDHTFCFQNNNMFTYLLCCVQQSFLWTCDECAQVMHHVHSHHIAYVQLGTCGVSTVWQSKVQNVQHARMHIDSIATPKVLGSIGLMCIHNDPMTRKRGRQGDGERGREGGRERERARERASKRAGARERQSDRARERDRKRDRKRDRERERRERIDDAAPIHSPGPCV